MKFNSPIPQPLPKECQKAAKIFNSFVDGGNNGLDGVVPRSVLENAKGFAIFTVFKAGFLFSARAGSGIVIARLPDGTWSAPSAIGTAGLGVGGQAGAEMTDFLVVLNSRSAVQSFMAAGSLTLGGNLSIAIGPLGRNGEASGALNTSGKVAAMYSYSKTRGLFGGVSLEGSVIVERQDANAQAYRSDVSVKMLLSGAVPPAEWAQALIKTLEACTGLPGNRRWVSDQHGPQHSDNGYMFGSVESPRDENGLSRARPIRPSASRSSSYFDFSEDPDGNHDLHAGRTNSYDRVDRNNVPSYGGDRRDADGPTTDFFETKFESDFLSNDQSRKHPRLNSTSGTQPSYPFGNVGSDSNAHKRSVSAYTPSASSRLSKPNPFESSNLLRHGSRSYDFDNANDLEDQDVFGAPIPNAAKGLRGNSPPKLAPKAELTRPLGPGEGVARAIALFDFNAVQSGDLSFKKGQVINVTEMSDNTDTWWTGKVDGRTGMFPANFVEVV